MNSCPLVTASSREPIWLIFYLHFRNIPNEIFRAKKLEKCLGKLKNSGKTKRPFFNEMFLYGRHWLHITI